MTESYKQSSLLIPTALPSGRHPSYINLDTSSSWHTSALISTAIETVTLPSRLRHDPNRDTLGTMTDLLNVMGKQTVASLQMGVNHVPEAGHGDVNDVVHLDIDFSPPDELSSSRQNGIKKPHLFGQTVVSRGPCSDNEPNAEENGEEVIRRRHAQQSVSRR